MHRNSWSISLAVYAILCLAPGSLQATRQPIKHPRVGAFPRWAELEALKNDCRPFLLALEKEESGGDKSAVGDRNLRHHAYGQFQIRQPYLIDVNKFCRAWRLPEYTSADRFDREKAAMMVIIYTEGYRRKAGIRGTYEVRTRVHNGGPDGWRRSSTIPHWIKVKKHLTGAI